MQAKLKTLLGQRQKQYITDTGRIPSAILLPIYEVNGQYHILFIKRSETVKKHKGQISFPGGTRDEADKTLLETALRECTEEIGLSPDDVTVLGELDDEVTTTSDYVVTPFVGMIPWPYHLQASPDEVDGIIEIPIPALLDKNCLEKATECLNGQPVESYVYNYGNKRIWGATARILNKFLDIYTQAEAE